MKTLSANSRAAEKAHQEQLKKDRMNPTIVSAFGLTRARCACKEKPPHKSSGLSELYLPLVAAVGRFARTTLETRNGA